MRGTTFSQKFPKYWYNFASKNLFVTSFHLVEKIVLQSYTYKMLLAFSAGINFNVKPS